MNTTRIELDHDELSVDAALLRESDLFDAEAYRRAAGPGQAEDVVEHYLVHGWRRGLEPGPNFEGRFLYPYFRSVGFEGPPALTYLRLQATGWTVYRTRNEAEAVASIIRSSQLFDGPGYAARARCLDGLDPALHYVIVGEKAGIQPSADFDPVYYHERYPDIPHDRLNLLAHYLAWGRHEGRRPVSGAARLTVDTSGLDARRDTVLLVCHQASRTGAPIIAHNIATRLAARCNLVTLLLAGGDLVPEFAACSAALVGPLDYADWHPADARRIVERLTASFRIRYAIANSADMPAFLGALADAFVPVVTLVNEFPLSIRPRGAMGDALDASTHVVFPAQLTADAAIREHPTLAYRPLQVFPQGLCDPPGGRRQAAAVGTLSRTFRPPGFEKALVVLGCGTVFIRKGVDLFLACASAVAQLNPKRPVRFVWIGGGYDPEGDLGYSAYLAEQIRRARLEDVVVIAPEIDDVEPAYALADVFFISSRLDPFPNVGIEAAERGLPVVCFREATGIAEILERDPDASRCMVPYLDVHAAARLIAEFADDEDLRRTVGHATRRVTSPFFDFDEYVRRLDELGRDAARMMEQRERDHRTIALDPLFDETLYAPLNGVPGSRDLAIRHFLTRWAAVGTGRQAAANFWFRRPCPGFHPQIYAHERRSTFDSRTVNPLADYIRCGYPPGPWRHEVIRPSGVASTRPTGLRVAIHGHFYYPELIRDFMRKVDANRTPCDLLLSTDDETKALDLRDAVSGYTRGTVAIRIVPNRGRDIGPLLTAYADAIDGQYDLVGHVHSKQSPFTTGVRMGDSWREFLWQNLIGDLFPMLDIIVARFAADATLGLVFPDDPHLPDWGPNLDIASGLAERMGLTTPLPPFFDFPVGTMFWARPQALAPLFHLKLDWQDYPEEPVAVDGTILHTLERLLPLAAAHAGFRYVTTHIPGVTW